MRGFLRLTPLVLLAALAGGSARAAPSPTPRQIIAESQQIVSPDGIEVRRTVTLGGIRQWITIRGNHRSNPILLFIHGGPGFPIMPASWSFQRPWEEYFTVVQWDQRLSGKTYAANDPAKVAPTVTVDRLTADAEELIQYLRREYHQKKIFVLGHSFGSIIGLRIAQRHPDWLYAYIGASQVVNARENERLGFATVLAQAKAAKNMKAVRELEALKPFVPAHGPLDWDKTVIERKWMSQYGGYTWNRPDDHFADIIQLSPDYSDQDIAALWKGVDESAKRLWGALSDVDFDGVTKLDCPVVLFHGSHDLDVSHVLVARWFKRLHAPIKKLVWFEESSHMPMMEEPGRFFVHLVEDVRPLAQAPKSKAHPAGASAISR